MRTVKIIGCVLAVIIIATGAAKLISSGVDYLRCNPAILVHSGYAKCF